VAGVRVGRRSYPVARGQLHPQVAQQTVEIGDGRAHRGCVVALSRSLEPLRGSVDHRSHDRLCLRALCDITTTAR
jgi:hypothetical protein